MPFFSFILNKSCSTSSLDLKNCDVENFKLACNFLANENIFVFRMGSRVGKKISYGNSKIIDYAT